MVGVSNAPGCMVDANCLLLRNDGVDLLTAGGSSLGESAVKMVAWQKPTLNSEQWPSVSKKWFCWGVWPIRHFLLSL